MEAIVLKGTSKEIADFFARRPELGSASILETGSQDHVELPEEVVDWMDEWGLRPPRRHLFERLITEALSWDGVRHRITKGRKGQGRFAGRVGFVNQGENEAFGRLGYRDRLTLRLDYDTFEPTDFPDARPANIAARPQFGVHIYVRTEEALKQAIDLLRMAFEAE